METANKKKSFSFPSAFTILFFILIIAVGLTWVRHGLRPDLPPRRHERPGHRCDQEHDRQRRRDDLRWCQAQLQPQGLHGCRLCDDRRPPVHAGAGRDGQRGDRR